MLKLKDYYVKLHKKKKEEKKTDSQAGKSPFQLNSHMDTSWKKPYGYTCYFWPPYL